MRQSPPLTISRDHIDSPSATIPGSPLFYIASIFQVTLVTHPDAVLLLAGSSSLASAAVGRLTRTLTLPQHKMQIVPLSIPQYTDQISVIIDYYPSPNVAQGKSCVEFEVDVMKFSVDFEVSPDGAYVEEVKTQWEPLRLYIKVQGNLGLRERIKIATKIVSVFAFDRIASDRVESSVKNKIQLALSADTLIAGTNRTINVEFFGAAGMKLQDGSVKPFFEGGLKLTVPFDLF
jgi:hypothetical protein